MTYICTKTESKHTPYEEYKNPYLEIQEPITAG